MVIVNNFVDGRLVVLLFLSNTNWWKSKNYYLVILRQKEQYH